MRSFLKILSILMIGGITAFNVVACNKCTSDNNGDSVPPNNKPVTYDVFIGSIVNISFWPARESIEPFRKGIAIQFYEKDCNNITGVKDGFWTSDGDNDYFLGFIWENQRLISEIEQKLNIKIDKKISDLKVDIENISLVYQDKYSHDIKDFNFIK